MDTGFDFDNDTKAPNGSPFSSSRWISSLALFLCVIGLARPIMASEPESFFIKNVRVFDGHHITPSTNVLTQGELIFKIGKRVRPLPTSEIINGAGKTLLPGLIDSHAHVFRLNDLREALLYGVTTEIGLLDDPEIVAEVQSQRRADDRADLVSAVSMATVTGGHPTQFGIVVPTIDLPSEANAFVDARIDQGAELIKIVVDDYSLFGPFAGPVPTVSRDLLRALVAAAHGRGLKAIAHVSQVDDGTNVFLARGDGLAHMPLDRVIDRKFIRAARRQKGFIVPTLTVSAYADGYALGNSPLDDPLLSPWLTPFASFNLTAPFPPSFTESWDFVTACDSIKRAHHARIPLLVGTDSASPGLAHGASVHRELEFLVHCGLTPMEALHAATASSARHFDLHDRGNIAKEKVADLIMVNGDPTKDIMATRDIDSIWRRGKLVDRAALLLQASQ